MVELMKRPSINDNAMIPDSGQSKPASTDHAQQKEPAEVSQPTDSPESPAPEAGDGGVFQESGAVKVSHRAAKAMDAPSHLHPASKTSEDLPLTREKLREKLLETLNLYKNEHPLKGETVEAFAERIQHFFKYQHPILLDATNKELDKYTHDPSLSKNMHCSLQLAIAMTALKLEDSKRLDAKIELLLDQYNDVLPDFIKLLQLNHEYTINPKAFENEDKLNFFCELAQKSHFMPSTWLLARLGLMPGSSVSPSLIIDMLTSFESRSKANYLIIKAFMLDSEEVDVVFEQELSKNATEYHQTLWIFAVLFNNKTRPFWHGSSGSFSPQLQQSLHACLLQTLLELQGEGFEKNKPAGFEEERKKNTYIVRKFEKTLSLYLGIDVLIAAEKDSSLSSYQRDISGLILAWHYKQKFIRRDAAPLKCAGLLKKVAKRGNFPLLNIDAAKIFANFGRYEDALKCLDTLLRTPLSSGHRKTAMHLYETYSLALQAMTSQPETSETDQSEWLAGTAAAEQTGTRKKTTTKSKNKKGKGKSAKQKQPAHKHEKTKVPLPEASETLKQPDSPDVSPTPATPVAEACQPETSSTFRPEKKPGTQTLYQPEGGWLPEGHPEVSRFYGEIHSALDNCDQKREAKIISRWLKNSRGKPVYGRVCEEAAWFYIRQMESPFSSMFALEGETVSTQSDMAKLAGQWLSRTEACYFQTSRGAGNNPDELKELIVQTYSQHPDWQQNPEYRKRVRCICSSRGHLYSNLSAYHSSGRYSWSQHQKHTDRYRAFYHLKELADPGFKLNTNI